MADRSNHYEAAFEAFVRSLRIPCVAVDEAKRAAMGTVREIEQRRPPPSDATRGNRTIQSQPP